MARVIKHNLTIELDLLDDLIVQVHEESSGDMTIIELENRAKMVMKDLERTNQCVDQIKQMTENWSKLINKMSGQDQDKAQTEYEQFVDSTSLTAKLKRVGPRVRALKNIYNNLVTAKNALEQHLASQQPAQVGGPSGTGNLTQNQTGQIQYKVEVSKIKPPIFFGSKTEWAQWWPLFNLTIHNDNSKPKFIKMAELTSLLKGEAKDVITGLQLTDQDYDIAIKTLLEKYDDSNHIIRELHRQLVSLKPSSSFEDDKKLLLDLQRITRMLKNLQPIEKIHAIDVL